MHFRFPFIIFVVSFVDTVVHTCQNTPGTAACGWGRVAAGEKRSEQGSLLTFSFSEKSSLLIRLSLMTRGTARAHHLGRGATKPVKCSETQVAPVVPPPGGPQRERQPTIRMSLFMTSQTHVAERFIQALDRYRIDGRLNEELPENWRRYGTYKPQTAAGRG